MTVSIVTYVSATLPTDITDYRGVYHNHEDAVNSATEQMHYTMSEYQNSDHPEFFQLDVVELDNTDKRTTVVRIINPYTGYEHEAYIITDEQPF